MFPGISRGGRAAVLFAAATAGILAMAAPAQAINSVHPTVVSANPDNNTPHMLDGTVFAFAQVGNRVYVAGSYTRVRNYNSTTEYQRRFLVALDRTTGLLDMAFQPNPSGTVRSIVPAADGQSIYVAGDFTSIGGGNSNRVARLDLATGARVPGFTPPAMNGGADMIRLVGGRLIVGGRFQAVGGQTRRALVALNAATGAADPWLNGITLDGARVTVTGATSPVKIEELDVSEDGRRLVFVGNFSSVAGQPRHQIAVVDLTTSPATLNGWTTTRFQVECGPSSPTYTTGIDISADGSWMVVVTKGRMYTGRLCDAATRWNLNTSAPNQQPTWINYTGGDTLLSVGITEAAVYVGGHQRWMNNPGGRDSAGPGAVVREGIAALDPVTGLALPWNPGKTRGVGTQAIYSTPQGLWIGSDGSRVAGEYHGKIAFFPL